MLSQSLTAYVLKSLILAIKNGYKNSFLVNLFYRLENAVSESCKSSKIVAWCKRDVFTAKYYETSVFYRIFNMILGLIFKFLNAVQTFFEKITSGSFTGYVVEKAASSKYLSANNILALFIGFMFIVPHEVWNNLYAFIGAVFFAAWIAWDIAKGRVTAKNAKGINVSMIGFLIAVAISVLTAIHVSDALRIGLFIIASIVLLYAVYALLDTKEKLMGFLRTVLFAVTVTALFGIVQRFMGVEVDPEYVDTLTNHGMPGRVFSTFANPNNFAELLLLFIPFYVPLFLWKKKKRFKILTIAGFAMSLIALAMTYSRSCWVGLALAAVLFVLLYDVRLIVPFAVVVFAAVPLLPDTIMNRIFTIGSMQDTSNSYRIYIWTSCLRMMKDFGNVGLGLGPASFKAVYPNYAHQAAISAPHSHMLYMEIMIEMGLLGFLSFICFIYSVVKKGASAVYRMDKALKAVVIGGFSSLLGIAFVCCAEYVWFYPRVMFAFWIIPGLILAAARASQNEKTAEAGMKRKDK